MTDTRCEYGSDREDLLIAYLYDEIDPAVRRSFEVHLSSCRACRHELEALRDVRSQLSSWAPPTALTASGRGADAGGRTKSDRGQASARRVWWEDVPAWARVAAAVLVFAASAGLANLTVHYDRDGVTVRTGWMKPAETSAPAETRSAATAVVPASAPWRSDLAALEEQLRGELRAVNAHPAPARTGSSDAEILRQVRALISESERRQQSELALRVAAVVRDVNATRTADLARIEHTLGVLQNTTGAELIKQRQQMMNYLTQVSFKR
jgi:hypothetical protein